MLLFLRDIRDAKEREMKKLWFVGTMGVVACALSCVYCVSSRHADADPIDTALMQSPVSAAIVKELAAHNADSPPMSSAQRQDLFAERFTERFRKHEPRMAVRAKFEEANHVRNRIKLMCPARMEPWNMDRVALSVWREAKDCLGENCDIDLYETYIGSPPIKVGELRNTKDAKTVADIHYLPRLQSVDVNGNVRHLLPSRPRAHVSQRVSAHPPVLSDEVATPIAALHP